MLKLVISIKDVSQYSSLVFGKQSKEMSIGSHQLLYVCKVTFPQ